MAENGQGEGGNDKAAGGLNPRQAAFVRALLAGGTQKQAAIAAGYSADSAESQASRLMRNAKVAAALAQVQAKAVQEAESTAAEVLTEVRRVATSDIGDLLDPATGAVLPVHKMPLHARRAVASIKVEALWGNVPTGDGKAERTQIGTVTELKFWNKNDANQLLAKKHGLLVEKVEHSASASLEQALVLAQARRRKGGK